MKGKFHFKVVRLWAIAITVTLLLPTLSQGKGTTESYKEFRAKILKQLNLAPDKEKTFLAVDTKYAAERKQIIAELKKTQKDLQAALSETKPDETKIKGLVESLILGQDKLFTSFKDQRNEELAVLSPVEQGKYLMAMVQWRQKMMKEFKKKESGKMK